MDVFAARAPIFDVHLNVFAYQLAFQGNLQEHFARARQERAQDLTEFLGLADLLGHRRGVIEFDRQLLLERYPLRFAPGKIVIGLRADLEMDAQAVEECRNLKGRGYQLALRAEDPSRLAAATMEQADILEVNFPSISPHERQRVCCFCEKRNIVPQADGLRDESQFEQARSEGFGLFGGEFFRTPTVRDHVDLAPNRLTALQLLKNVSSPSRTPESLAALVREDVGLTFQLLKLVNSVWFGLSHRVESIQHALVLLGNREVHRWASMMALAAVSSGKPNELLELSLTRARFAELLAAPAGMKDHAPRLFLLGMFSVVDAIMDRRMEDVLAEVALDESVKRTLLRQPSTYTVIHKLMLAYEHGQWVLFEDLAGQMGIHPGVVPTLFHQALEWSANACSMVTTLEQPAL